MAISILIWLKKRTRDKILLSFLPKIIKILKTSETRKSSLKVQVEDHAAPILRVVRGSAAPRPPLQTRPPPWPWPPSNRFVLSEPYLTFLRGYKMEMATYFPRFFYIFPYCFLHILPLRIQNRNGHMILQQMWLATQRPGSQVYSPAALPNPPEPLQINLFGKQNMLQAEGDTKGPTIMLPPE